MGDLCDEQIDECLDSECVETNTARCEDALLSYTCVCKLGFSGKYLSDTNGGFPPVSTEMTIKD